MDSYFLEIPKEHDFLSERRMKECVRVLCSQTLALIFFLFPVEGIEMLNYQRIGSMHLSKYRGRGRLSQHENQTQSLISTSSPSSNQDLADLEPSIE